MARPIKPGLDYFPFDTDFSENAKVGAIMGEFGSKGVLTMVYLLSAVYKKGYYLQWNKLTEMQLVNKIDGLSSELANQIVARLIDYGTFNKELFNSAKVLTSQDIQDTYKEATKRRKSQKLSLYRINVNNNSTSEGVNDGINTQSKVNKSKVNKTKDHHQEDDDAYKNLIAQFQQNFGINSTKPLMQEDLRYTLEDFTSQDTSYSDAVEIVKYALTIAVAHQGSSWSYVKGIIKTWLGNSLFDMAHIKDYQERRNKPKQNYGKYNQKPKETGTDWNQVKAKKTPNNSNELQERLAKIRGKQDATS